VLTSVNEQVIFRSHVISIVDDELVGVIETDITSAKVIPAIDWTSALTVDFTCNTFPLSKEPDNILDIGI
tara:strand:+ start:373 stop:582 length:210 start_codon:yes stop_codon:yes gene_type:complete